MWLVLSVVDAVICASRSGPFLINSAKSCPGAIWIQCLPSNVPVITRRASNERNAHGAVATDHRPGSPESSAKGTIPTRDGEHGTTGVAGQHHRRRRHTVAGKVDLWHADDDGYSSTPHREFPSGTCGTASPRGRT